ncbi:spore germination protein [Paenibacillus rhizovicinus]|uniref:Spore germination protein n=1 Tax=Paenibacillus rhizovicinus TaxID=2704463 RepID=A0A6C0NTU6_9BACL|nr:spore germination protein [Paenibacillus rhizovicinus]QHW29541.1 spore germination protein [Paenibacillus rhizovicinus]
MTASERNDAWTLNRFTEYYGESSDVMIVPCRFDDDGTASAMLIYVVGLCDSDLIHKVVLPVLNRQGYPHSDLTPNERLISELSLVPLQGPVTVDVLDEYIFKGDLLLYFMEDERFCSMGISNRPQRTPDESNTEISIKGPKDGFIEDLHTNVALIRKRIRSHSLHVQEFTLGRRTKTKLALLYFADILNPKILEDVRNRLKAIDTDGIYSINQLEEALTGSRLKLLPLLDYTGRPDYCVNSLLSGRFLIIVDGNPLVLIGPAGLSLLLKSPEDIHFNYMYVSFARMIRVFSLFLSIFLPGIWVALMAFHQDQIPFRIMATISVSRLGLPFSSQIEMFILLMLLEIFREAGVRLPTAIGQTLTSIGGLIIGDAAIRAGLVSPSVVVIGAITAVSSVTLVNQSLSSIVSILRLFFYILSCYLGMYGVILGIVLFIGYMSSQKSFGVNYLAPLSPLRFRDVAASFLRIPFFMMKKRPGSLNPRDEDR